MASDSESDDDEQEVLAMRARIAAKKEEQERERARTMMQDKRSHEQDPIFSTKLLSNQPPLEGRGSYTFEDGSHYDGEWMNFLPHGEGVYTWPSGTVYKGSFSVGSVHGKGVLTKRNIGVLPYSERGPGKVEVKYEGSFLNGSADGLGRITFPLDEMRTNRDEVPTKFEGSFWNNTAQGDGCFTNPCSTETGKWHAGKYVLGTGARRSAGTRAAPGVTRPRPVEVEVESQKQQAGKSQGIEVWGAAVFNYFDTNHDGKLSSVELARALKSLPKTKPQKCPPGTKFQKVEDMINAMDADQNGYVEESEWVENLSKCPGLYAALAEYTDENGELPTFLSYEELLARRKKELAELQVPPAYTTSVRPLDTRPLDTPALPAFLSYEELFARSGARKSSRSSIYTSS